MKFSLNINSDASHKFTEKLAKLRKSALPVAIRQTLNDTGFDMKQKELLKSAKESFIERQPNFFKANSRIEQAQGFNVNQMVATVGMVESGLHNKATNYAVKDLNEQEQGGDIGGRSFKPLPSARRGGRGVVRPNARISQINNIVEAKNSRGNNLQKLIRAALHAGIGGYVLGDKVLFRIRNIRRVGRNIRFTKFKLFSFTKHGVAKVHSTHFMYKAGQASAKKMESFYAVRARQQFDKALR